MNGLFWVNIFILLMLIMIILVPRRAIVRLFPVGFIGGFGQAVIILGLLVPVLGFWRFKYTDVFSFAGVPWFIGLAWIPEVIVYSYYMKYLNSRGEVLAYLAGFILLTGLSVHWLFRAGHLIYNGWNSILTLPVALAAHATITYYILKTSGALNKKEAP